ncbi:SGNH/GDSL hydrolase family protein [Streptococcus cuniculipharyngis]|uniref:SGNH/GDSL hydrolase family protein n=1 Tax=Streptococcus cuniculipharyngis TaxID=1562651 RepID=A0A5C5SFB2_9STRE|nr:SGNH/GDSL hydrolase family protein [Streptococcus cuniculipharyngis]TWS98980.1 SGNH/GDSL hydrolase family protein [Streptococcus cuniculipharyngis]
MINKILRVLFFLGSLTLLFFILFDYLIPKSKVSLNGKEVERKVSQQFNYVAIGDSLTEGVGDSSQQGGFVGLLKEDLARTYQYKVKASNYGLAGNTSQQILTRMEKNQDLQNQLQIADLVTLTVGGNDLIQVIRKNFAQLTVASFAEPMQNYQKNLRQMITLARQQQDKLPIYIIGIYNPFYLNFQELTEMQEVVDQWNQATEAVSQDYQGVYFVPVNDLLYKGTGEQTTPTNDVLFAEDNFHPNTLGYQIIANAVMEKLNETRKDWQK